MKYDYTLVLSYQNVNTVILQCLLQIIYKKLYVIIWFLFLLFATSLWIIWQFIYIFFYYISMFVSFLLQIQRHFTSVHLSGVEVTNMGQQILGSYPVHFHMTGAVDEEGGYNPTTYIDNLAIHHCFSRCVAIHGTHGLLV